MPLKAFQNSGLHPKRKRCVKIHQLSKRWVLHLYWSTCTSKCHLFIIGFRPFPRWKVSHVSSSASRRTGRPICIKTSRCALDQTPRDRRLTSLCTSRQPVFFCVLEFHLSAIQVRGLDLLVLKWITHLSNLISTPCAPCHLCSQYSFRIKCLLACLVLLKNLPQILSKQKKLWNLSEPGGRRFCKDSVKGELFRLGGTWWCIGLVQSTWQVTYPVGRPMVDRWWAHSQALKAWRLTAAKRMLCDVLGIFFFVIGWVPPSGKKWKCSPVQAFVQLLLRHCEHAQSCQCNLLRGMVHGPACKTKQIANFKETCKHEPKPFTFCMISCTSMLYIARFALHKHVIAVVWSQIASRFISCSMGGRTRAQTCTRPNALSMATSNDRTRPLFVDVSGHKPGCV